MPGTQRRPQSALIDQLIEQPYRFSFFQAVRLLDLWLRRHGPAHGKTLDAVLRFQNSIALSFPPSEIEAVAVIADDIDGGTASPGATTIRTLDRLRLRQIRLTPAFMGFLGVNGVLPHDYTAKVAAQITYRKNEAGRAFFDNFSHRSMLLFYRAWAKCRIECCGDAGDHAGFLATQLALAGRQRPRTRRVPDAVPAAAMPDEVTAHYAALIRHRPLQTDMLAGVLAEYFGVPTRCQPFVGKWVSLSGDNCTRIGKQNNVLGRGVVIGERCWRRDAIVRVWLGPLTHNQFGSFLAGGSAAGALRAMLALFALPTVAFEVRPVLRAADVRHVALDGRTRLGHAAVLITTRPMLDHQSHGYRINFSPE